VPSLNHLEAGWRSPSPFAENGICFEMNAVENNVLLGRSIEHFMIVQTRAEIRFLFFKPRVMCPTVWTTARDTHSWSQLSTFRGVTTVLEYFGAHSLS
jgi:hypothetical protein